MADRRQQLAKARRTARYFRRAGAVLEWQGTWWPKPGSICADGSIVGHYQRGEQVPLIQSGLVYIEQRRLPAALRLGWTWRGDTAPDGLAMVSRA